MAEREYDSRFYQLQAMEQDAVAQVRTHEAVKDRNERGALASQTRDVIKALTLLADTYDSLAVWSGMQRDEHA